jgi:hypothetical protein
MKKKKPSIITIVLFITLIFFVKSQFSLTIGDIAELFKGKPKSELLVTDYDGPLFKIIDDNQTSYIDTVGRLILKTEYDNRSGDFYCNRAKVFYKENYGYIDKKGKLRIPFKYVKSKSRGNFKKRTEFNDNHTFAFDGELYNFINKEGVAKFKVNAMPVLWQPKDSFIVIGDLSNRGIIDYNGKTIIPQQYSFIRDYSEGLFAIQNKNNLWGYVNKENELVIDTIFESAKSFNEGLAAVMVGEVWGVIDKAGKYIVLPRYAHINSFSEGLAQVCLEQKVGFIDKSGKEVIPLKFDYYFTLNEKELCFKNSLMKVELSGRVGWINKQGDFIIKPKYDMADKFINGIAKVYMKQGETFNREKFGYINIQDEMIYTNMDE